MKLGELKSIDYYLGALWAITTLYKEDSITREVAFDEIYRLLIHLEMARKQ